MISAVYGDFVPEVCPGECYRNGGVSPLRCYNVSAPVCQLDPNNDPCNHQCVEKKICDNGCDPENDFYAYHAVIRRNDSSQVIYLRIFSTIKDF